MTNWLLLVQKALSHHAVACHVIIAEVKGSSPREVGADMVVTADGFDGTIGGGQLEFEALHIAQQLIASTTHFTRQWRHFALGPSLGQCCGGAVTLCFVLYVPNNAEALSQLMAAPAIYHERQTQDFPLRYDGPLEVSAKEGLILSQQKKPLHLYIYGAGHVGRALVSATANLGLVRYWIDDDDGRFPSVMPPDIEKIVAKNMASIARYAAPESFHIILSYSHKIDEAIAFEILRRDAFLQIGMIGSDTKARRMASQLAKAQIASDQLSRLHCPVGIGGIRQKAPAFVALSIAAQIAQWQSDLSDMAGAS